MDQWIEGAFSSGGIATAIAVLMIVEGLAILWFYRRTGRGIPASWLVPTLLAGAALVLTLRGALIGSSRLELSLWLGIALAAHVWDLRVRWMQAQGRISLANDR